MTTTYAAAGGRTVDPVDVLVAKAWTVVEFAAETGPGGDRADVLDALAPRLEDWLTGLLHRLPSSPNGAEQV